MKFRRKEEYRNLYRFFKQYCMDLFTIKDKVLNKSKYKKKIPNEIYNV